MHTQSIFGHCSSPILCSRGSFYYVEAWWKIKPGPPFCGGNGLARPLLCVLCLRHCYGCGRMADRRQANSCLGQAMLVTRSNQNLISRLYQQLCKHLYSLIYISTAMSSNHFFRDCTQKSQNPPPKYFYQNPTHTNQNTYSSK